MNNTTNEGSKLYLYSITSVAILGGLLFGYDTAVISGAEKGLEAFFLSASDFQYNKVMHGITSSSALIGCVLGGALSGVFASRLGRRNSLRLAAVLFFLSALGSYYPEVLFFEYGKPNMDLYSSTVSSFNRFFLNIRLIVFTLIFTSSNNVPFQSQTTFLYFIFSLYKINFDEKPRYPSTQDALWPRFQEKSDK